MDVDSKQLNIILKLFQNGDKKIAYKKMKGFLNLYPSNIIAIYNYAFMSEKLNNIESAIKNYKKIIETNNHHWQSRFNLYVILINQEKYKDAEKLIDEVLKIKDNYQPALRDKSLVLYYRGKPDEALIFINKAIQLNKNDYIALNILGLIYSALKQDIKAEKVFNISIKLNPQYSPSYNNLGKCYQNLKKYDLALLNFKKSYNLNNDFSEAINNLANIYIANSKYKKGIEFYKKALKKGKKISIILYNIGAAYSYLKDFKTAEKYYLDSLKLNPNDQILSKNLSNLYLAQGKFKKAWKYFDGRLKLDEFVYKNSNIEKIRHKLWKGEKLNKYTKILIIKEQGVGDEILYSSMYSEFLLNFPNTKIEADTRLISIFKRSFKNQNFVPLEKYSSNIKEIENFQTIIYAGSLGRLFRNNIKDFPQKKYLILNPSINTKIQKKIYSISNLPKIGITWKSKREILGIDKSINLEILLPILKLKNFTFINLQYGDADLEIQEFFEKRKIYIHTIKNIDLFNDFESVACILNNLDLFITISNSTTHLAGAVGVPTWLIKPKEHAIFHYWLSLTNKTPWYNSIKMFQHEEGWIKTIEKIKKKLLDFKI